MSAVAVVLTAAVVLGLLVREYLRQRRVIRRVSVRAGLSRTQFTRHFLDKGTPAEVSAAVFDSLAGGDLTIGPDDDLLLVHEVDHEILLDLLVTLRKATKIDRSIVQEAWHEYGNISTVRNLVEMIGLARQKQDSSDAG